MKTDYVVYVYGIYSANHGKITHIKLNDATMMMCFKTSKLCFGFTTTYY